MLSDSCAYFPSLALPQQLVHTLWPFFRAKDEARCSWRGSGEEGLDTKKKSTKDAGWPGGGRPSKLGWQACLGTWSACQPASLPACSLVTLSTMKSVETSEVCSRQARRRERTKEVHFLDTTTDRGADLSQHRTGFDKWQILMFPYISAIKEVF